MSPEFKYEIIKTEVEISENIGRNVSKTIDCGFIKEQNYDQFFEYVSSVLGFYYCISEYFKEYCISGDDVVIELRITTIGLDFILRCLNMRSKHHHGYRFLPFVILRDPQYILDYIPENTFANPYLKIWPLLLSIYCVEKRVTNCNLTFF